MIKITVEELDIIVQASVEQALTELKKIVPQLKKTMRQVEDNLNNVETKGMVSKVQQAVQQVKNKVNEVKNTGIDKQLQSQFNRAGVSVEKYQGQLEETKQKLREVYAQMDSIQTNTWKQYTPEGVELGNKAIEPTVNNALGDNKQYQSLSREATKLEQQITSLNSKLNSTKQEYNQISGKIQEASKNQSIWSKAVSKVKSGIGSVGSGVSQIKESFNNMPSITGKINTRITQMGKGMKQGLGHIFKYAAALISLESIYGALSGVANAWLNSQNQAAQQLNANIEYMKYAMGSALAPVIEFVVNLVYQLMKGIQSVVYALTGVNIFAKASADSYKDMANSAKKTAKETKQLVGIHDEINNIQNNDTDSGSGGSGNVSPDFDLSEVEGINSTIIDAIKNGDWYTVGETIGEKLNEAMNSIPWDKIQDGARKIGTGIAELLNGFIKETDWYKVGDTLAQGINTVIYLGYSFVTTFDWSEFGKAIGEAVNGAIENTDFSTASQTFSEAVKGVLDTATEAVYEIDWNQMGQSLMESFKSVDWGGIFSGIFEFIGSAIGSLGELIVGWYQEGWPEYEQWITEHLREAGGNVILGFIWGIIDSFIELGKMLYDNVIYPLIEGFCNALGIHSPSTVFYEIGTNIIQGLLNGIISLVEKITEIWNNIKNTATEIWNNITSSISNAVNNIKDGISNAFQTAYNTITNIFSNIGNFFSNVWNNVKNTFSNLGTSIGNAISGAVRSGINGIISMVERTINSAIGLINGAIGLINKIPGVNVGRIRTLSLPRLATGAVLKVPTVAEMAEYPGASQNPEIVTPQNIMEETFDRVMARYQNDGNNQPIYLTVKVGDTKLGQILLDDLRDMKRRTGKDIEALVGG